MGAANVALPGPYSGEVRTLGRSVRWGGPGAPEEVNWVVACPGFYTILSIFFHCMGSDVSLTPKCSRVPRAHTLSLCLQERPRTLPTTQKPFSLRHSGEGFLYSGGLALGSEQQWAPGDFGLCFYLDPAVALRALGCSGGPKSVSPVEF